jgi:hypothetical protein
MTSARMGIVPLIQSLKSSEIPSPQGDALGYFVAPLPGVGARRALLPDEPGQFTNQRSL